MRTASVFTPRSTREQSNGDGSAPAAICTKRMPSASASSDVATNPPTTSECPPRYLVDECEAGAVGRREAALERGAGRIPRARILEALVLADCALGERGGQRERRHDRPGRGIGVLSGVDRPRLESGLGHWSTPDR